MVWSYNLLFVFNFVDETMKANEIELSLELSIGGCYKNIEKSRSHENEKEKIDEINTSSRSDVSESYVVGFVQDEIFSSDSAESRKKREIQALRRREAIKKREEKQKRCARSKLRVNERLYLEMQQNQARAMDRQKRENESSEELLLKKDKGNGAKLNMSGIKCGDSHLENMNLEVVSNGSIQRTSSAFLDYQSTSQKAGSSSTDTGSNSNYSEGGQQQLSATATSDTPERSDLNGPSSHMLSDQANGKSEKVLLTMSSSNIPTPGRIGSQKCEPTNKLTPIPQEQTSSASRQCNEPVPKPPIPQRNSGDTTPLPRMPLVSATGDGPNGKTVNGFLYSYSKTEVNIVCVCHGSTFSPAEFVEHAGGVDISHPLKQITIVPTPFG